MNITAQQPDPSTSPNSGVNKELESFFQRKNDTELSLEEEEWITFISKNIHLDSSLGLQQIIHFKY